ncbi:MAG: DUF111 family protein [Veillonellaceae bacterium]|nr:DUF111 family protein [Veillonellaceae bacterium]
MSKALYWDTASGIAGNMLAGALISLGVPEIWLRQELAKLPLDGYEIEIENVNKRGIAATYFQVHLTKEQPAHRHLPEILDIFRETAWDVTVKQRAASVFWQLAYAEAQAHQIPPERVHFHEVGAVDCIIDISTAALGLTYLDADTVLAGAPATGSGTVEAAHGTMPIPAPATAALLRDVPTMLGTAGYELTTPTGAALLRTFASKIGAKPARFVGDRVGYGAGSYDLPVPNVLAVYLGYTLPELGTQTPAPHIFGDNSRVKIHTDEW